MKGLNYKEDILSYCNKIGLNTVGFTKCRIFTELKDSFKYRKENLLENEFEERILKIELIHMCIWMGERQ